MQHPSARDLAYGIVACVMAAREQPAAGVVAIVEQMIKYRFDEIRVQALTPKQAVAWEIYQTVHEHVGKVTVRDFARALNNSRAISRAYHYIQVFRKCGLID